MAKSTHHRRRWIIIGTVVVVVALLLVLVAVRMHNKQAASASELTTTVARGTVSASVTASGQIVNQYTYSVSPNASADLIQRDGVTVSSASSGSGTAATGSATAGATSGSLGTGASSSGGYQTTEVAVGIGDHVKTGQLIAKATNASTQSSDLSAAASNAQASLNYAYAALSDDQATYNDLSTSTSPTVTTQIIEQAKKQVSADYVSIDTAKSALATANENLANHSVSIKSPAEGTILSISTAVGASASQVATIGAGKTEISTMVSEYDISKVGLKQHVDITLGTSATEFLGTVASIAPQPTSTSGVEDFQVIIDSPSIPASARVGMTVTAAISIDSLQDVLNVPASAITTIGGHMVVTVLTPAGKQLVKRVQVGLVGDSSVEIISGLTKGERIVYGAAGTVPIVSSTTGPGSRL